MDSAEQVIAEARRAGIDLDLVDTNLALSVGERWRQHAAALALATKLRAAQETRDAQPQRPPAAAR